MSIQNLKMPLTEEDLIELLKDQKKGYLEIKQELNVTKKGENPLRQMLISLENAGKIEKEVSEDKEYYKIRTLTQAGGEIRSNRAELFIAAAIILVFTFIYANLFLSLKQIPGPMYGGDYYTHYGIINHIYNGNPPWTCPQNQNEYAFYPWLLHFLVAVIGKITGNLLASYILYFPVLVVISSGVIVYLLGREIFQNKVLPLLFCFGWMGTRLFVDYIPANFTPTITTPLLLLTTLKALKTGSRKWIIAGGVSFGLFIMSHIATLPPGTLLLVFAWIYYSLAGNVKLYLNFDTMRFMLKTDRLKLKKEVMRTSRIIIPIAVIGFLIGLLYWGPVFFIYMFSVKNAWAEYTMPDYETYGQTIIKETILGYLFNIDPLIQMPNPGTLPASLIAFLISLLTLTGLIGVIKDRKEIGSSFLGLAFATGLFGYFHYLITLPILHTNYSPLRIENFMLNPAAYILMFYGIYTLYFHLRTDTGKKIFIGCIIIFLLSQAKNKIDEDYANKWTVLGQTPENPAITAMASWVREKTDKNAVFLSTEELSFALNGLTGRKLVVDRRTHSNPFVDINERIADASVMLYGNNEEKTLELLKKYNVSYLYWDLEWLTISERTPTLVLPEYTEYLSKYGVRYKEVNAYLDPTWSVRYKKYDMLLVSRAKNDSLQPWSDELNKHLKPAKGIDIDGQAAYRIYEINYTGF
jgi:hypothetical protein